jgi:hypothetical protein
MTAESSLIDSALRSWKTSIDRTSKLFGALTEEQLLREIAPGKNRLIYLWGHLAAVNDTLLPLFEIGQRLHPELDAIFISNPDGAQTETFSGEDLKQLWNEINEPLWAAFSKFSALEWLQKHAAVSQEDFAREPHRNRFTVLLGRTTHLSYHLGQAILADRS